MAEPVGESDGDGLGGGEGDGVVGSGDGSGEGVGDFDGLGLGDGDGDWAPFGVRLYPWKLGLANPLTGTLASAWDMKSCQITAGSVPPTTLAYPSMLCMGIRPFV